MSRKNALAIVAVALTFLIIVSTTAGQEPPTPSLKNAIVEPMAGMLYANVALVLAAALIGAFVLWAAGRRK